MGSCLGSAGFANQEAALNVQRGHLAPACATALLPLHWCETAALWHALLRPFEVGGSATGVLIIDESHVPSGDDKVCALILRSARTFNINFLPESN